MASTWQDIWIAEHPAAPAILARVDETLGRVADPLRARDDLRRFVEAHGAQRAAEALAPPGHLDLLLRLAAISRWAFEAILRRAEHLTDVVGPGEHGEVWGRQGMARHLVALGGEAEAEEDFLAALITCKEHHLIRIMLGDLTQRMRFESVVSEISDLVDVITEAALRRSRAALRERWGEPPLRFVILGMGKLGGRELNYSSDIDLIFCYDDSDCETSGHDYAIKLGARVIRILDEPTALGRLFRVDMRLRPEGDRGELALSLRETVDYYYSVGRPWERQALIKARAIAGDLDLGRRLFDELKPWIYPRDPHWEDLDGTRAMRRRIEERREIHNVKTGAGGIRDIEFLVQFFQMSHGGRIPELRGRATLPVLRALGDVGLISSDEVLELEGHYRFLRMVEHRLQIWEDRQLHDIPEDDDERRCLAGRCGFIGPDALARFDAKLSAVRERVRTLADAHYLRDSVDQDAVLALLTQDEVDQGLLDTVLGGTRLKDRARAADYLRRMARDSFFLLSRSRTELALAGLVPLLLHEIDASPDPDQTLANLCRITDAVGGRATFYDLLTVQPRSLALFCDLAGWSSYLVNLLVEVPGLGDEVADTINQPLRPFPRLREEARDLIRGIEAMVPPLRFFQARETVAAAVRDLEGLPLAEVNLHLSQVALAIIEAVLDRLIADRAADWGHPQIDGRPARFAILGLGKLGSRALSYASDMDVIFVAESGGVCPDGEHDGEAFWNHVARDLMRTLDDGRLYEIDPRLRPWGDQGPLVTSPESLAEYWQGERELWERLAMVRISPIAGNRILGEGCVAQIRRDALGRPLPADARQQVVDMRRRLEESVAGRDHVKRGWGGYVDHEFIAQFFCMGKDPDDLPVGSAITDLLGWLAAHGRIPAEAGEELREGLIWLRFVEARQRLSAGKASSSIPVEAEGRLALARRCHKEDLASFDLHMHHVRQTARRWFNALIG